MLYTNPVAFLGTFSATLHRANFMVGGMAGARDPRDHGTPHGPCHFPHMSALVETTAAASCIGVLGTVPPNLHWSRRSFRG